MVSFCTTFGFAAAVAAAGDMTAEKARPRVENHLIDEDVRRAARALRAHVSEAQSLVVKLQSCAGDDGATLEPRAIGRPIEREVPRRRAEIALP
jgi:hypothetical protein